MPVCKRHSYNYSRGGKCPLCEDNKLRKDSTPMWKIGGLRWPRINSKRSWEKLEDLPTKR